MIDDTAEREAFEKWWADFTSGDAEGTARDQGFAHAGFRAAWRQARASIPAGAPEGWADTAEREAFEKWFNADETSVLVAEDDAWIVWQAARASATAGAPEGWVLVPRKPTPEMDRVSAMKIDCKCGRRITQWGVNTWAAMPDGSRELIAKAVAAARAEARREALKEAARACRPHRDDDAMDRQAKAECEAAIRALLGDEEG